MTTNLTQPQTLSSINGAIAPKHWDEWIASAVDPEIIRRNVWTIEDPREVDQLLNRNNKRKWKHSEELVPGWAVGGVDPKTGERSFKGVQFKPDKSPIDPDTQKPRKYFSPSKVALSPLFLEMEDPEYWQKLLLDFTTPIILAEGAKKAGAVLSKGFPCISIPGVATGGKLGRLRPELELFCKYGRRIYLAFDRDILKKRPVQQALLNLGRMIAGNGAMVYVLEWNNFNKGIDDYLAAGGDLQSRIYDAKTLEEWRDEQEDEPTELMEIETCRLAMRYKMVNEKLKGRLRFNNLKGEVELDGQTADVDDLRIYLALKHNIDIPAEDCAQIVTYISKQQLYNPVAEYLHQCAALYDPDPELLASIAKTYLGTDSELHATFIRKTLISAVARSLSPGCKVDTVCILAGRQGVGKSSFWRVLAGDWFDDSIGSVSDKDERLKLHQSWFVEWAELEAVFKRRDISAVKAFITTQTDQIRPPYGRTVKEFPRPSIIVGTTNFNEFLADPTGNRRFWVVPIQHDWIPLDDLASERDRIWAAATHAFMQGESWTLPTEMKEQAVEAGQEYELSDPWEEAVLIPI
uniref:VapE domain-containing protein n=1 Tax=Trichocoleus desertorum TaxID=1481672 RepID=UPI0025B32B6E|nr:VapE domain-containing protein [Trichocoleus desertorum]